MTVEITEDFLAPLVRHLRADSVLQELHSLTPAGGVNPVLGPPEWVLDRDQGYVPYKGGSSLWIFRGFDQTGEPYANVEGTGSCSITLEEGVAWARKTKGKSLSYLTLDVYYHCDPTRDEVLGAPITYDARDKCHTLHKRLSQLLHIKDKGTGGFLMWGAKEDDTSPIRLVSSFEGSPLRITPVFKGDGMVVGQASFELEVLL